MLLGTSQAPLQITYVYFGLTKYVDRKPAHRALAWLSSPSEKIEGGRWTCVGPQVDCWKKEEQSCCQVVLDPLGLKEWP